MTHAVGLTTCLMVEVADAGQRHHDPGFVGCCDHFLIGLRAARLITAVAPASISTASPSAKGKKASEAATDPIVRGESHPLCAAVSWPSRGDAR